MKRNHSILMIAGFFGLFLSLSSAAQAALCRNVCTPTASCDLVCTAIGGGSPEFTTCGEWGVCAGAPLSSASALDWMTASTSGGCAAVADASQPASVEPTATSK